jgi:phage host-nuclease inhibitor protein Gam
MTTTRLSDHRESAIQTLDDAGALFDSIANSEIKIARAKAMAEARIATIKENVAAKIEMIDPDLDDKREALAEYIDGHPEEFQKPRKVKTSFGNFGLHKACKVKFINKAAALDFVVDQQMTECFKTKYKIVTEGIKDVLLADRKVTGAKLLDGEIAHYSVKKALLAEAKETA